MSNNRIGSRQKVEPQPLPEEINPVLASETAAEEMRDRASEAADAWRRDQVRQAIAADTTGRFAGIGAEDISVSDGKPCRVAANPAGFCAYVGDDEYCAFCGEPDPQK